MKRQMIRLALASMLVLATVVAAIIWSDRYEKSPDPAAIFQIKGVRLEPDRDYVWLEAHLRKEEPEKHDLRKPIRLITGDGNEHEAADTAFAGTPETGFTDIWVKFWIEKADLKGPIKLKLNGGTLTVKSSEPVPNFAGTKKDKIFKSSDWRKSWFGF